MNEERPGGKVRIGDKERDDAVKRLGAHYEAGRLTADEHTERVGQALAAKTAADLTALFDDLPEEQKARTGPVGSEGTGGRGSAGPRRPAWAARGPLGRVPLPVLVALAGIAVLASIACTVGGGHPPILPLLLLVAGVVIYKKRQQERRA